MMEPPELGLGNRVRDTDPGAANSSLSGSPAAKRVDTKLTPAGLLPAASDIVPPLDIPSAALQQPMTANQIQHEQAAALLVFDEHKKKLMMLSSIMRESKKNFSPTRRTLGPPTRSHPISSMLQMQRRTLICWTSSPQNQRLLPVSMSSRPRRSLIPASS